MSDFWEKWRGVRRGLAAVNAAKTCCKRGHLFTDANTRLFRDSRGRLHRGCRQCGRDYARRQEGGKVFDDDHERAGAP